MSMYNKKWVKLEGKDAICVYYSGLYYAELAYFSNEADADLFVKALDLTSHYD